VRRRERHPAVWIALLIAVAVATWFQNDRGEKAAPAGLNPTTRNESPGESARAPRQAPRPRPAEASGAPESSTEAARATQHLDPAERAQVEKTLALIESGGPFPYEKDGTVFSNREKRLPQQPRGYYREYTVPTPGASNRGARRIVRGTSGETYYTRDHYGSFTRIDNGSHAPSTH